jgi:hypothetical protein
MLLAEKVAAAAQQPPDSEVSLVGSSQLPQLYHEISNQMQQGQAFQDPHQAQRLLAALAAQQQNVTQQVRFKTSSPGSYVDLLQSPACTLLMATFGRCIQGGQGGTDSCILRHRGDLHTNEVFDQWLRA